MEIAATSDERANRSKPQQQQQQTQPIERVCLRTCAIRILAYVTRTCNNNNISNTHIKRIVKSRQNFII